METLKAFAFGLIPMLIMGVGLWAAFAFQLAYWKYMQYWASLVSNIILWLFVVVAMVVAWRLGYWFFCEGSRK